jgi:hypothetical protein
MGVLQGRRAHGCASHMGQHGPGMDPRGCAAEVLSVIGGPGLPLDVGQMILVGSDAPAMGVTDTRQVLSALHHERVLRVDQGAFHLGLLVRPKAVEAAHRYPSFDSTSTRYLMAACVDVVDPNH